MGFFQRYVIPTREPPVSSDVNLNTSYTDETIRELMRLGMRDRVYNMKQAVAAVTPWGRDLAASAGFIADGWQVRAVSGMGLLITAGLGFIVSTDQPQSLNGHVGVDDTSRLKPLVLDADIPVTLVNGEADPRIDLIEARVERSFSAGVGQSRPTLQADGSFLPNAVARALRFLHTTLGTVTSPANATASVSVKRGTPGATPAPPTTTSGYVPVAYVYVPALAVSLTQASIVDARPIVLNNTEVTVVALVGAGVNGGLSAALVDAPPGFEVSVVDRAANNKAGFDIYIWAGDANFIVDVGNDVYVCTPSASADNDNDTAGGIVKTTATTSFVSIDATLVTALANAAITPAGTLAKSAAAAAITYPAGVFRAIRVRVTNQYLTTTTLDYAIPGAITVTVKVRLARVNT